MSYEIRYRPPVVGGCVCHKLPVPQCPNKIAERAAWEAECATPGRPNPTAWPGPVKAPALDVWAGRVGVAFVALCLLTSFAPVYFLVAVLIGEGP